MVIQSDLRDVPPWLPLDFCSGHPALDLVNTISNRAEPALAVDRMNRADKILLWSRHQGLLDDDALAAGRMALAGPEAGAALVARVAGLRRSASALFEAIAAGAALPAAPLAAVLRQAARAPLDPAGLARIAATDANERANGAPPVLRSALTEAALAAALAGLVLDGLHGLPRARVRRCPQCGWLFCDRSRGGRRRWCSMLTCGNRAKARQHRARQHRAHRNRAEPAAEG